MVDTAYVASRDTSTTIQIDCAASAQRRPRLMRRPTLRAGARVALVAPAGPLRGDGDLARAQENVRALGCEPVVGAHVLARTGYLAGSDSDRLSDLNAALTDDAIDAVWCARGGYGAMRILDHIDYAAVRRRPKPLIGYSDITALHAAMSTRCELVTFHGPTARAQLTPFSRASLERALAGDDSCGAAESAATLYGGRTRGRIVGGNLALLCALSGTPYKPDYRDTIVVVEDVSEAVYRVDRMLTQLRLAGDLPQCRGIVFGQFTDIPTDSPEESLGRRTLESVLGEISELLKVPCIVGAPIGHIADQWTIPLGADAELDADERSLRILQGV
ncbi:MAG TPA: LD-carboxypeptidase [Gemmatimonadaceae bacterium]|nr:LD-carboxypeptidase [Gemmatimonadaceae bacterium]